MQTARYEAAIKYISEYECIYVKEYHKSPPSMLRLNDFLIACQINNIEMNLRNIEFL